MLLSTGTRVEVANPGALTVAVTTPRPSTTVVVPVRGPAGRDGQAGAASDASIAESIADPDSLTRAALVPVIDDTTEPPINLSVLFRNGLSKGVTS